MKKIEPSLIFDQETNKGTNQLALGWSGRTSALTLISLTRPVSQDDAAGRFLECQGDTHVAARRKYRAKCQKDYKYHRDIIGSSAIFSNHSGISSQIFCMTAAATATWEHTAFNHCKITAAGSRMPEMQQQNGCGGGSAGHRAHTGPDIPFRAIRQRSRTASEIPLLLYMTPWGLPSTRYPMPWDMSWGCPPQGPQLSMFRRCPLACRGHASALQQSLSLAEESTLVRLLCYRPVGLQICRHP
jgi:hypothetical protein